MVKTINLAKSQGKNMTFDLVSVNIQTKHFAFAYKASKRERERKYRTTRSRIMWCNDETVS